MTLKVFVTLEVGFGLAARGTYPTCDAQEGDEHDVPAGKLPEARAVPGQDKGPGRGEGQHDEGKYRVASHRRRADAAWLCECCVVGV